MGWNLDDVRALEFDEFFTIMKMMREGKLRKGVL